MKCFWWIRRKSEGRFSLENWPELVYMLTGSLWLLCWEYAITFFFLLMVKEPQLIHRRINKGMEFVNIKVGEQFVLGMAEIRWRILCSMLRNLIFLNSQHQSLFRQRFFSNSEGFIFTLLTVSFVLHNLLNFLYMLLGGYCLCY